LRAARGPLTQRAASLPVRLEDRCFGAAFQIRAKVRRGDAQNRRRVDTLVFALRDSWK
jgi:hypothetical protein